MKKLNQTVALFLILAIALTMNPLKSEALWRERPLPGIDHTDHTALYVGLGAVLTGTVIYAIVKTRKKHKKISSIETFKENSLASSRYHYLNSFISKRTNFSLNSEDSVFQEIKTAAITSPVNLIISPISKVNEMAFGNMSGIQIGLSVRF